MSNDISIDTARHQHSPAVGELNWVSFPWGMPGSYESIPSYEGAYRGEKTVLTVQTDVEAVASWLAEVASDSTNTADRYRREVERLLLWAADRGKTLSDLGREDFLQYHRFLADPHPIEKWVMEKRRKRNHADWRPFLGPMSNLSRHQAMTILYSLMRHLADTRWLYANPMPRPEKKAKDAAPKKDADDLHALNLRQEDYVYRAVERIKDEKDRLRMRWIMRLLLTVGPRSSEIVHGLMRDIQFREVNGVPVWVLNVTGKGEKSRKLPLAHATMEAFRQFRVALGLPEAPEKNEPPYPLFPKIRGFRPGPGGIWSAASRNGLYKRIQAVLHEAADIAKHDPNTDDNQKMLDAATLSSCTTHGLRHTALKRFADETGGDMRLVKLLGGHESIQTSNIYTRATFADLVEKLNNPKDPAVEVE